ncbi:hypothetical protein NC652_012856 [Populus alba x Populus x berolinensis]|nr:hypothetical protein NC652_012856 [Populus alba x Populus x berolinensis]
MSHKDLTPDTVTYSSTPMKGLCHGGRVLDAQKLFKEIMHGCLLLGSLKLPRICLPSFFVDGMRPTAQTYNVMIIKGLLKEGLSDEAYELFRKMEDDGCVLDRINRPCIDNRISDTQNHQKNVVMQISLPQNSSCSISLEKRKNKRSNPEFSYKIPRHQLEAIHLFSSTWYINI